MLTAGPTTALPGSETPSVRKTTGRLEAGDFDLHDVGSEFAKGLEIVTRAIHSADTEIANPKTLLAAYKAHTGIELELNSLSIKERNLRFAALVRDKCAVAGWVAGWETLVAAAPNVGLHPRLVHDVSLAANVYGRLAPGHRGRAPVDIKMEIGPNATNDSIYRVGPKSLGGTAWKTSEEYKKVLDRPEWRDRGYSKGFSPCVAYGWIAVQIKVIPAKDSPDVMRLQLLNIIDYDLDYGDDNKKGFQSGFDMGAYHAQAVGTKLQGAAFTGMISYDFQSYVRHIQQGWVADNNGSYNLGPADASPEEWAAIQVADCAALVPFAYTDIKGYNISRVGMITGMIQLQCHDLLFDAGCSNRITTVQYSEAAGVAKYGLHAAYAIGFFEAIAQNFVDTLLSVGEGVIPPYGYSACMVAGPWDPYNTRYRAWERTIKYTRQLENAKSPEAKEVLRLSRADLVLKNCDLEIDAGIEWARAMTSDASALVPRNTVAYFIPSIAPELFTSPGVAKPDLCKTCTPKFEAMIADPSKEEIHAIGGLPETVTGCRPAGLAAAIRRASIWAISDDCCEICACRTGAWVDATAYTVLSALMHDEPLMGPSTWCLQNYFVGAVTFWPINLPFLLSGFDLLANMTFEDGAMGHRDIVDI